MKKFYDPPSGWQYGFPKEYKPLPEEKLEDTLRRDGYPERLMEVAMMATRFWETDYTEPYNRSQSPQMSLAVEVARVSSRAQSLFPPIHSPHE